MGKNISNSDLKNFISTLELAGYEGAKELVEDELLKIAKEKKISLLEAARIYADDGEEQDTSYYQLWLALTKIDIDKDEK